MSILDKAKELAEDAIGKGKGVAGSVLGKGKEITEGVVGTVKDKIGGDHDETGTAEPTAKDSATPPAAEASNEPATGDAITPADVAEAVSDPDLPHPDRPAGETD